jgi:Haemolysin-III related
MRRADHAGVFLLIAGTYTPVCLLALEGAWRYLALSLVSLAASAAIVLRFAWVAAPKWLAAATGIALGWVGVALLPQLATRMSPLAIVLLALGGIAYTVGAVIYARGRPDSVPTVFGYHELFHALTIVGVACQYVAIAFFVIHAGLALGIAYVVSFGLADEASPGDLVALEADARCRRPNLFDRLVLYDLDEYRLLLLSSSDPSHESVERLDSPHLPPVLLVLQTPDERLLIDEVCDRLDRISMNGSARATTSDTHVRVPLDPADLPRVRPGRDQ